MKSLRLLTIVSLSALAIGMAGCGGSDGDTSDPGTSPAGQGGSAQGGQGGSAQGGQGGSAQGGQGGSAQGGQGGSAQGGQGGSAQGGQGGSGSPDADNDGYTVAQGDCDDDNPAVNPGATEECNGIDDNCDGQKDEGVTKTFYKDSDNDGFGVDDAASNQTGCTAPAGFADQPGDCDDNEALAFPGNPEVCDGIDNDCANGVDDGVTMNKYYQDNDKDGFGDDAVTQTGCTPPTTGTWVTQGGDCDDNEPNAFPGNPEVCDTIDNDCDPNTGEPGQTTYYKDGDGDTYGDDNDTKTVCGAPPAGYIKTGGDCDDSDKNIHPNAIELCNGKDDNCVNGIDEGPLKRYIDKDKDGFGDAKATPKMSACETLTGYSKNNLDCNDNDKNINPDAAEIPGNSVDENCDGNITSAGTQCGHDTMAITSIPAFRPGKLSSGDQKTGGPRGNGYYWDDWEISTKGGQPMTVLYASMKPASMRPVLYTYGPNSCTASRKAGYGYTRYSPKGAYQAAIYYPTTSAGYYYAPVTTYSAGQLGDYKFAVVPGKFGGSCGNDFNPLWPLGWRRSAALYTSDKETSSPVPSGYYADDFEVYLTAGHTYTFLQGGSSSFGDRIYLAKAGACTKSIASSSSGITNYGAKLVYKPTTTGIYAAFATSTSSGKTGSYKFNAIEGNLGKQCFAGNGSNNKPGDSYVLYPLGGTKYQTLSLDDRMGDFGTRVFDDWETYLEAGDKISISMHSTTGSYTPKVYLTGGAGNACKTIIVQSGQTTGTYATINYTVGHSGIYTIVTTSRLTSKTGNYTLATSVQ